MNAATVPQRVFISGGMSGLGKALAGRYLQRGADVAIFDLVADAGVLSELQDCKRSSNQQCVMYQASVTDFESLDAAVTAAVTAIGAPELAINCAGIQRAQPFDELPRQHFEQVIEVNLLGSRNFAEAVLSTMSAGGRLALVASMAGFAANYSYAAYCASKFGVIGLGRVLRIEYRPRGIQVSLICPPEVDTPMVIEEIRHMHPASRKLKDFGGTLSVDEAVGGIMAGLDAGRGVIIPGAKARLTYLCNRYLPDVLMNWVVDRIVATELAKLHSAAADSHS